MSAFNYNKPRRRAVFCEICKICENKIIEESAKGKEFEIFTLPSDITDPLIIKILYLRNKGIDNKTIAKLLCIDHQSVYKILDDLNVPEISRARLAQFQTEKVCSKSACQKFGQPQPIYEFAKRISEDGRISYDSHCHTCKVEDNRQRNNRSYQENPDKWKEYKKKGRARENKQRRERRNNDPLVKLRQILSTEVRRALRKRNAKKTHSCLQSFSFTIEQLHQHLESLFAHPDNLTSDGKVWMTQQNHGPYKRKTWDDNDPSTWKWQLDHIIPHSDFEYKSMDCEEFRAAWALSNLRPYSAKQNVIDGTTKIRHKKKEDNK